MYRLFSYTIFSLLLFILGMKSYLLSSYYSLIMRAISFFSWSIRPYMMSSSSFLRISFEVLAAVYCVV